VGTPIYLDHHATTPLDPRVREAMAPYETERFGHPASRQHPLGWDAEKGLEVARARVADLLGATPREIVFTSGGAEADNLAIKGAAFARSSRGRHVVTTSIEARPVLEAVEWLVGQGWSRTLVPPDAEGRVAPEAVVAAVTDDTALVSLALANAEVGTLQDVAAVGLALRDRDTWLHVDAQVAAPWVALDVKALGAHLLSLSGHRMHGPKGIGALYVRRKDPRVRLVPLVHGGGFEQGLRGGTPNIPGAVGLGAAADLCRTLREGDAARVAALRDRLEAGISAVGGVRVLGDPERRLPNVCALSVEGVEGEALLLGMPDVALSTGSACTSATARPSHVLEAMDLPKPVIDASVRFTLGRFTTDAEIAAAIDRATSAIRRIRALS
jgi:cysteine desulfurase